MLTLYNPPAYLTGCSQAVHLAEPALVRNYDYAPELLERVVLGTFFTGRLEPPLYAGHHEHGFGTLYTAVYRPADLTLEYRWPGSSWQHSVGSFSSGQHQVVLGGRPCPQP
jgi:predicted choloylglycine hydrolase